MSRLRLARTALTLLGGVVALALPLVLVPLTTHTAWSTVGARFQQLTLVQLGLLGAIWFGGLFVHTYVTTGALPGLSHRRALVLNFSGSTVSHLAPFGGVLGMGLNFTMLRSWGYDGSDFTVLVLLNNAWNALVRLLLPALALALLVACTDHKAHGLLPVAFISMFAFVGIAFAVRLATRNPGNRDPGPFQRTATAALSRLAGHPAHEVIAALRTEVGQVVRRSWRRMSLGMSVYVLLQATLLYLCLVCVGGTVSPIGVFAAYATGAALTLVPLTPGGVGFAEAGTAGLLVAFGANPAAAAAGVILYSTFTRWMEIPFGAAGTAWWWIRRTPMPTMNADQPPAIPRLYDPGTALAPQYGA